jgi:hypothetical protein
MKTQTIRGESIGKVISRHSEYYPFRNLIKQNGICQPYEENLFREMVVSTQPFSSARYYVAEFHSPILDVEVTTGTIRPDFKSWGSAYYPSYVSRINNPLLRELLGDDFNGEVNLLNPELRTKLEELFKSGLITQKTLGVRGCFDYPQNAKTTIDLMKKLSSGKVVDVLGGARDPNNIEPVIGAKARVEEIAFFAEELSGHRTGKEWHEAGYGAWGSGNIVDSGYITIKQEDYARLERPSRIYVRALDIQKENQARERIAKEVRAALKIFPKQLSPTEVHKLKEEEFNKFLGNY